MRRDGMLSRVRNLAPVALVVALGSWVHAEDDAAAAKAVVDQMYSEYRRFSVPDHTDIDRAIVDWVKGRPYFTSGFASALDSTLRRARKADPEIGLGADPIWDAQDYPEGGYRARRVTVHADSAVVELEGAWAPGKWTAGGPKVRLVRRDGRWLIDSIGQIAPATARPAH